MKKNEIEIRKIMQEKALNNDIVAPPCCTELATELFDLFLPGKMLENGHYVMPIERMKTNYPNIDETDLKLINEYFHDAETYCEDISQHIADIYGTPFIPSGAKADTDQCTVISICKSRYPWLLDRQITSILNKVCWLSNR